MLPRPPADTASFDSLTLAALPVVTAQAARDLGPTAHRWLPVHRSVRAGRVLQVFGADTAPDHYAVLLRADGALLALTHRAAGVGARNPFLGEARHHGAPGVCCHGLQVVAFRPEPGITAIRFRRNGRDQELAIDPASGRFLLVDWTNPAPILAFTRLVAGRRALVPAAPGLPFSRAGVAAMPAVKAA
jgi:hypothetical protein